MIEIITEEMKQIKKLIIETISKRESLKAEMEEWYARFPTERFVKVENLLTIDQLLSNLDTDYKRLWDYYNGKHQV